MAVLLTETCSCSRLYGMYFNTFSYLLPKLYRELRTNWAQFQKIKCYKNQSLIKKFGGSLCLVLLQVPKWFGLVQIFCAKPKIYLHIVAVTKIFKEALNAVKFLGWLKKFGPAQTILGPVKGQGISINMYLKWVEIAGFYF